MLFQTSNVSEEVYVNWCMILWFAAFTTLEHRLPSVDTVERIECDLTAK